MVDVLTIRGPSSSGHPGAVLVGVTRHGDELVVALQGEADADSGPGLRADLAAVLVSPPSAVVVDLAGLSFCDLRGVYVLREFVGRAAVLGVPVELRGMSHLTRRMFALFSAEALR